MIFCNDQLIEIYKIFAIILSIVKLFIPIILIIYGTIDLFFVIIKGKKENFYNSIIKFVKKILVGIFIFFLPSLILLVFNSIGFNEKPYSCMYNCVLNGICSN